MIKWLWHELSLLCELQIDYLIQQDYGMVIPIHKNAKFGLITNEIKMTTLIQLKSMIKSLELLLSVNSPKKETFTNLINISK